MKLDNALVMATVVLSVAGVHSEESLIAWFCGASLAGLYVIFNKD